MKQVNKTKEALIWLILLVPFMYAFAIWNKVPEKVPTHFDINGKPDDYSGKAFALLLLPLMNVAIYFLFIFITQTTMNGQPLKLNVFLAGILLFLALLGNYLRTVRSNFFVGIRTPW